MFSFSFRVFFFPPIPVSNGSGCVRDPRWSQEDSRRGGGAGAAGCCFLSTCSLFFFFFFFSPSLETRVSKSEAERVKQQQQQQLLSTLPCAFGATSSAGSVTLSFNTQQKVIKLITLARSNARGRSRCWGEPGANSPKRVFLPAPPEKEAPSSLFLPASLGGPTTTRVSTICSGPRPSPENSIALSRH